VLAASLPELRRSPNQSVSTWYLPFRTRPMAELPGSNFRSSAVIVMTSAGFSFPITVATRSSFWTLAGAPGS
jgi:hypothetical protein